MKKQTIFDIKTDTDWWQFVETLSDEFINQTGFGIYAHISPSDVQTIYKQYQKNPIPMRHFAKNFVRLSI